MKSVGTFAELESVDTKRPLRKVGWRWRFGLRFDVLGLLALLYCLWRFAEFPIQRLQHHAASFKYNVSTLNDYLVMKDGTRLSVTYTIPTPQYPGETFPVLFDYRPYRKDDSMYLLTIEFGTYFAQRGYIHAKVDIRGTGSSEGRTVPREYSEIEMEDGEEVIKQISRVRAPALKAIVSLHASEDLWANDVHYLDGVYHHDEYILSVDQEAGIPAYTDDMRLDQEYISNRLNSTPWIQVYTAHQKPADKFWTTNSVMYNYSSPPDIPMYLIGGLLDGYRDFALNLYTNIKRRSPNSPKIKVVIGPWNHAWPEHSEIGPNYDGRRDVVRFFDQFLKGKDTGMMREPDFAFFVRDYVPPSLDMVTTPGTWRYENTYPLEKASEVQLFPTAHHSLATRIDSKNTSSHTLEYRATVGTESGCWWGERTPDMAPLDQDSLVYDTDPFGNAWTYFGKASVSLRVSSTAPRANWIVRVEDVAPSGKVSLITGGLINSAQRDGRQNLTSLIPNEEYTMKFDIHFSTWTFRPGHRLRIAINNAMFRMIWPSPHKMNTTLFVDHPDTWVKVPVVEEILADATLDRRSIPEFTQIPFDSEHDRVLPKDGFRYKAGGYPRYYKVHRPKVHAESDATASSKLAVTSVFDVYANVRGVLQGQFMAHRYLANDEDPAASSWLAEARHIYIFNVTSETSQSVSSTPTTTLPSSSSLSLLKWVRSIQSTWIDEDTQFNASESAQEGNSAQVSRALDFGKSTGKPLPDLDLTQHRYLEFVTFINITSDAKYFYSTVRRTAYENGTVYAERTFVQRDERYFQ
ncbi:hypothetical protein HK102_012360 [Quaeritorhiza haematococci]|nr:hypothetical protein HK102_012360 [Quaeritorhiza haematococci]